MLLRTDSFYHFRNLRCYFPQVQCHGMSNSVCEAARRMGGDKVKTALELVGCAEEVKRAIKYTFGTSFICQV